MKVVGLDLSARYWAKVECRGPDECWPWRAHRDHNGYGKFSVGGRAGRMEMAHRVAVYLAAGEWPAPGMDVDHTCHNDSGCRDARCEHHACQNPRHLEVVPHRLNNQRGNARWNGAENRAKTHCPAGHPYDDRNTSEKQGANGIQRRCRECARIYSAQYRAAKKEAAL